MTLANALRHYWTSDKFYQGDFVSPDGRRFCILGLAGWGGWDDTNPLPPELRVKLNEVLDKVWGGDPTIDISIINDNLGQEEVIEMIEVWEMYDG